MKKIYNLTLKKNSNINKLNIVKEYKVYYFNKN